MDDMGLFIALATVSYLRIMLIFWKPKRKPKKEEKATTSPSLDKVTPDDVIKILDFMLTHNVIDTNEYNRLMVKVMPFV